jgi:hypothetical protein
MWTLQVSVLAEPPLRYGLIFTVMCLHSCRRTANL